MKWSNRFSLTTPHPISCLLEESQVPDINSLALTMKHCIKSYEISLRHFTSEWKAKWGNDPSMWFLLTDNLGINNSSFFAVIFVHWQNVLNAFLYFFLTNTFCFDWMKSSNKPNQFLSFHGLLSTQKNSFINIQFGSRTYPDFSLRTRQEIRIIYELLDQRRLLELYTQRMVVISKIFRLQIFMSTFDRNLFLGFK